MFNTKTILTSLAILSGLSGMPAAYAAGDVVHIEKQSWSFAGIFGTYDVNQLQRGFQVFQEVCSSCHGARLIAFRNLAEPGGPSFSEAQVKALAAEYEIADATADSGARPAVAADKWPSPFETEQDARDANGGALPPDFSVLAKARGVHDAFPFWIFNYFTGYSEGGPDYIHGLLTGYEDEAPEHFELPEGKYYNHVFPGQAIGMAPPLSDGQITYGAAKGQAAMPETVDQYATDVAAFMMWVAEPHLAGRKQTGFVVLLFLVLFAGLMYGTKRKIWAGIEH